MGKNNFEMKFDAIVVIPVFNDWESVLQLLPDVLFENRAVLLVNDGSTLSPNNQDLSKLEFSENIFLLNLTRNLGHQRAIAIGLCWVHDNLQTNYIAIMDGDGEDLPSVLNQLIETQQGSKSCKLFFASRGKRYESWKFKFGYRIYKYLFKLLSGYDINFGHFSVIPVKHLKSVVSVSEIWNHFPAGIIKSRIPFQVHPFDRGARISGESKMNFYSLVLHGLSAISVFNDVIGIRMIALIILQFCGAFGALIGTVWVRLFTDLNIPGWSSIIGIALIIILIQLFSITIGFVFQILGNRNSTSFIPIRDYHVFINNVETLKF